MNLIQTLKPGTEEVVQKVKMEKNNNNTNYEKSINRRKVGEGEPTEEITKRQWTKSYIMAVKEVPQGHKMNDQNAPKGSEEEVQVNQVSKIQIQESCNTSSG